jgi:hypothetical protein
MSPPHVQESTPSIADETTPDGVIPGNIRADATDIADDMTPVARECDKLAEAVDRARSRVS